MKLLRKIAALLGLAQPEPAKAQPAVPPRTPYKVPVRDWAGAFSRVVPWKPRARPVRDRAFRRAARRYRAHDRVDLRRVRSMGERDAAVWRMGRGLAQRHDRCQKPLGRREWRFLERVAAGSNEPARLEAGLILDWNGR